MLYFGPHPLNVPGSDYIHIIRARQDRPEIGIRLPTYTFMPPLNVVAGLLAADPGAIWLIGNEIEINNNVQDNIMPDIYARAYHEAYHFIKGVDPTARVGIGSVTMATPGRLQYLDIVWDTYLQLYGVELPVDVWNFHLYILAERNLANRDDAGKIALGTDPNIAILASHDDPALCPLPGLPDTPENDPAHNVYCRAEHDSLRIFSEQVYAMRGWMKNHGLQDKPLIISEFASLSDYQPGGPENPCGVTRPDEFGRCMDPQRVTDYLVGATEFLSERTDPELGYPRDGNRLVQRWIWYSLYTPFSIGRSSNLLLENYNSYAPGAPEALSLIGQAFHDQASAPSARANLVAGEPAALNVFVENRADLGTATIRATFRNNGELTITQPFLVTFYDDPGLASPIGSAVIDPAATGAVLGCDWTEADGSQTATVLWENLPVGTHAFWAKIDSMDAVNEAAETDNVTFGTVNVYAESVFSNRRYVPILPAH
jgi:hypothetical protein